MSPFAWGLVAAALAALLYGTLPDGAADAYLRAFGAAGGALAAIAGATVAARRARSQPPDHRSLELAWPATASAGQPRDPRLFVGAPLQVNVDGRSCAVTLVNVSAKGALLRLHHSPEQPFALQVGQPVQAGELPTGTVARVGRHGVYVDFAVEFDPSPNVSVVPSAPGAPKAPRAPSAPGGAAVTTADRS